MHIISTLKRIVLEFGWLGCIELFAASLVAIGCAGELWIILNKLTRHVEPLPKSAGAFWRMLAWIDITLRPIALRLKIGGRKLSEAREQLLERLFVMLVAFGVGVEFIALMFSLHEFAKLNEEAGKANERAGNAIERAEKVEASNLAMATKVEELRKDNLLLEKQIQPRRISPEEKAQIKAFLSGTNVAIEVNVDWWDPERILLANDISNTLADCGFNVSITGISTIAIGNPVTIHFGIIMQIRSLTNAPAFSANILNAFNKAGVKMEVEVNEKLGTDARILVGNKPLR